jgi:hypothetical protein
MRHVFSIQPKQFEAINLGLMRALYCPGDGIDFEPGDGILLNELHRESGVFTGRWVEVRVTHAHLETMRAHRLAAVVSFQLVGSGVGESYSLSTDGRRQAVRAA